jgi:4-amino-4-deoxy-L-arabinose transferase-like glycosyltransferase
MDQENLGKERSGRPALVEEEVDRLGLVGASVLALAVRLYLAFNYYTINNDGVLYIEASRHFWEGRWGDGLASFYPPLYPLMIAAAYSAVQDWEAAGQFWPFVLSLLILLPLYGLLRRIYGLRAAQIGLFFYAVSPYLARFSLHVRSEMPYIFFLVLALYLLQRWFDEGRFYSLFLAGVCSAFAYLIRSEGFGLILIGIFFIIYRSWLTKRLEGSLWRVAFLLAGFFILAAPYILYLRWDTGSWLISRKAGMILSMGLAEHDPDSEQVGMKESDRTSVIDMIASHPAAYAKKVFVDFFRSLGVYFEAIHYSYLPFLLIGCALSFRGRFWEQKEVLIAATIVLYLIAFSLLYVNRRYAVPLAPLSLGWVGMGFAYMEDYLRVRWGRRGLLLTGIAIVVFLVGTLPKTLQAIGQEKLYLREAGIYLKGKPGNPIIVTTNARVAFYAWGQHRVFVKEMNDLPDHLAIQDGDYLALDREAYMRLQPLLKQQGWLLDREFSSGEKKKEDLYVLSRAGSS